MRERYIARAPVCIAVEMVGYRDVTVGVLR